MSKTDRIESLKAKHAELEETLRREELRPHPDDAACLRLKREKLALKDEISRMAASP
ncbi:MAG: YdcH family protein [Alphaproteobacteria bacterium]|nr:YdcH family protein [Alphaproteobacteria bacterium]